MYCLCCIKYPDDVAATSFADLDCLIVHMSDIQTGRSFSRNRLRSWQFLNQSCYPTFRYCVHSCPTLALYCSLYLGLARCLLPAGCHRTHFPQFQCQSVSPVCEIHNPLHFTFVADVLLTQTICLCILFCNDLP
jgi:hypothetical protein